MKKGVSVTSLELIAIGAMFCEHIAYMIYNYYSVQAFVFQLIGKLTIPIVCYLSVEYYRRNINVIKYFLNLLLLWAISCHSFYVFFQGAVRTHQNFIFDILLGLVTVILLDSKKIKRVWKTVLLAIIIICSIHFSNSPFSSVLFMGSFYYCDTFEKTKKCIIKITIGMILLMTVYLKIFSVFVGGVSNSLYLKNLCYLGFLIAIPILAKYEGMGTRPKALNHYFVGLYSLHFIVIRNFIRITPSSFYTTYLYIHLISICLALVLAYKTLNSKVSRAQRATLVMLVFCILFLLGYYFELTAFSLRVMQAAVKIEITGLVGMLMGFTWFVNEFCDNPLHNAVYMVEGFVSALMIYAAYTQESNALFYQSVWVKHFAAHSLLKSQIGPIYVMFCVYEACLLLVIVVLCIKKRRRSEGSERKRCTVLIASIFISLLCFLSRGLQINCEYDTLPLAMFCFLLCFTICVYRNDYLGNLQTEQEQDPLTGLCNRGFFVERVQSRLDKHAKGSMLMIDMDNFKHINDQFGHGTGDKVLIALGEVLKSVINSGNYISRIGGDEFCSFICGQVDMQELERIANSIEKSFEEILKERALMVNASISIGIAIYDGVSESSFEKIYENADKALYLAKNSGKRQFKFYV